MIWIKTGKNKLPDAARCVQTKGKHNPSMQTWDKKKF